ncbi:hypothetical protein P4233_01680 [Pseudomonas aeruginosa]|nr:hypothetical protein [Pseudomonas aeruginosa]
MVGAVGDRLIELATGLNIVTPVGRTRAAAPPSRGRPAASPNSCVALFAAQRTGPAYLGKQFATRPLPAASWYLPAGRPRWRHVAGGCAWRRTPRRPSRASAPGQAHPAMVSLYDRK